MDPAERSGDPAWLLRVPVAFLVGGDGTVLRSWVNVDLAHRGKLTETLHALNGS